MRLVFSLLFALFFAERSFGQTTNPTGVATSISERKHHPSTRPGEVLQLSLAELGNFDFDPDAKDPIIPPDVIALNGVTVRLHGFMIPMEQADDIKQFALVPNLWGSHGAPKLQQTVVVTCPKAKSVKYCPDEIVVEGKLLVGIIRDDGFILRIFAVDDANVKQSK